MIHMRKLNGSSQAGTRQKVEHEYREFRESFRLQGIKRDVVAKSEFQIKDLVSAPFVL